MSIESGINSTNNGDYIISPPRPLWHLLVLVFTLMPFGLTVVFTWKHLLENVSDYQDLFITLVIITLVIIIGAFILTFFCIQTPDNRYKLIVSRRNNKLSIFKDHELEQEYNLDNIGRVISKLTIMFNQSDYVLMIEEISGDSHALFDLRGGSRFSPRQWQIFSDRLAELLNKEYVREVWVEDDEGKLHPKPIEELSIFNYEKLVFYPIIIAIPLMGAIGYNYRPSIGSFFGFGFATASISVLLTLIFLRKLISKADTEEVANQGIYKKIVFPILFIKFIAVYLMAVLIIKLYSSTF
jgi:hypothetical protein